MLSIPHHAQASYVVHVLVIRYLAYEVRQLLYALKVTMPFVHDKLLGPARYDACGSGRHNPVTLPIVNCPCHCPVLLQSLYASLAHTSAASSLSGRADAYVHQSHQVCAALVVMLSLVDPMP